MRERKKQNRQRERQNERLEAQNSVIEIKREIQNKQKDKKELWRQVVGEKLSGKTI